MLDELDSLCDDELDSLLLDELDSLCDDELDSLLLDELDSLCNDELDSLCDDELSLCDSLELSSEELLSSSSHATNEKTSKNERISAPIFFINFITVLPTVISFLF